MKITAFLPLLFISSLLRAQDAPAPQPTPEKVVKNDTIRSAFVAKSVIATLAIGFGDNYRSGYTYPAGFAKNNITGFVPVSAKLDYAVSKKVTIGAAFMYDAFTNNYFQQYQGNGNSYTRGRTDNVRIFGAGLATYYHFGNALHIKRLDPFIGVGVSLINYKQSAFPQGDSTTSRTEHPVTASIKVGARYFISNQGSIYADLGYEKQSLFTIGYSCRFFKK